jgi:hypothetical protein
MSTSVSAVPGAYYPPETQVTPLTTIRRERTLPVPGYVLARIGQQVQPTDVVARAELPGDFRILPVARLLGVPASRVKRYLRVKEGDQVRRGQAIARRGIFARPIKSPIDGSVTAHSGGRLLIEARSTPLEQCATMYGTVSHVVESYGVVIETTGALIQGVWGMGGDSFGTIKCVVNSPDEPLQAQAIDPSCHGAILVGGSGVSDAALERARELQVRGIVVGGLSPALTSRVEQLPFPIIVTEGIGTVPMSAPIFHLLTTNADREATISGRVRLRWGVVRPEIIIPLPTDRPPSAPIRSGTPLAVGTQVRLVQAPYMGAVGKIVALPAHARPIETGAREMAAQVDVGGDTPVFVPLANLEVLC